MLQLLTGVSALGSMLVSEMRDKDLLPLRNPGMTEQFLFRRNMLHNTESVGAMLLRFCIKGRSITHENVFSVVDIVGQNYALFIGGVAEQIMNEHETADATSWVGSSKNEPAEM